MRRQFIAGVLGASLASLALTGQALAEETGVVHEIQIHEFKFVPDNLEVSLGDQIKWTNMDIAPHTATAKDKAWNSGRLKVDESYVLEVTADMTTNYFCKFHPNMKATLTIK